MNTEVVSRGVGVRQEGKPGPDRCSGPLGGAERRRGRVLRRPGKNCSSGAELHLVAAAGEQPQEHARRAHKTTTRRRPAAKVP